LFFILFVLHRFGQRIATFGTAQISWRKNFVVIPCYLGSPFLFNRYFGHSSTSFSEKKLGKFHGSRQNTNVNVNYANIVQFGESKKKRFANPRTLVPIRRGIKGPNPRFNPQQYRAPVQYEQYKEQEEQEEQEEEQEEQEQEEQEQEDEEEEEEEEEEKKKICQS